MRQAVKDFAEAMEVTLEANDHKEGWEHEGAGYLLDRLQEEVGELNNAAADIDAAQVRKECLDVANFAMMLWDVLKDD